MFFRMMISLLFFSGSLRAMVANQLNTGPFIQPSQFDDVIEDSKASSMDHMLWLAKEISKLPGVWPHLSEFFAKTVPMPKILFNSLAGHMWLVDYIGRFPKDKRPEYPLFSTAYTGAAHRKKVLEYEINLLEPDGLFGKVESWTDLIVFPTEPTIRWLLTRNSGEVLDPDAAGILNRYVSMSRIISEIPTSCPVNRDFLIGNVPLCQQSVLNAAIMALKDREAEFGAILRNLDD